MTELKAPWTVSFRAFSVLLTVTLNNYKICTISDRSSPEGMKIYVSTNYLKKHLFASGLVQKKWYSL